YLLLVLCVIFHFLDVSVPFCPTRLRRKSNGTPHTPGIDSRDEMIVSTCVLQKKIQCGPVQDYRQRVQKPGTGGAGLFKYGSSGGDRRYDESRAAADLWAFLAGCDGRPPVAGAHVVALRPRSLAVLHYLVERPGRLVTKAELWQQVWGDTHVTDSVLRVCVREIRAVLGDTASAPQYVETVGQEGYRFLGGGALEGWP